MNGWIDGLVDGMDGLAEVAVWIEHAVVLLGSIEVIRLSSSSPLEVGGKSSPVSRPSLHETD